MLYKNINQLDIFKNYFYSKMIDSNQSISSYIQSIHPNPIKAKITITKEVEFSSY